MLEKDINTATLKSGAVGFLIGIILPNLFTISVDINLYLIRLTGIPVLFNAIMALVGASIGMMVGARIYKLKLKKLH